MDGTAKKVHKLLINKDISRKHGLAGTMRPAGTEHTTW